MEVEFVEGERTFVMSCSKIKKNGELGKTPVRRVSNLNSIWWSGLVEICDERREESWFDNWKLGDGRRLCWLLITFDDCFLIIIYFDCFILDMYFCGRYGIYVLIYHIKLYEYYYIYHNISRMKNMKFKLLVLIIYFYYNF